MGIVQTASLLQSVQVSLAYGDCKSCLGAPMKCSSVGRTYKMLNVQYATDESTQYSSVDIWLVEDFVD